MAVPKQRMLPHCHESSEYTTEIAFEYRLKTNLSGELDGFVFPLTAILLTLTVVGSMNVM